MMAQANLLISYWDNELHLWGSTAYILDNFHKFGKLGIRGKKCIFIRYSENSKGYICIGEDSDGRITEIKSRDVIFLENDFPKKGNIDKSSHLYKMEEAQRAYPIEWEPVLNEENSQELLPPSQLSGRDEVANAILIGENNNDPQLRRSTPPKILKRLFAIENEVYIVTPHDDEEPKTVKEALEYPAKEK